MNIRAMKQFFAKRIVSVLVPGAALGFLSLAAGSLQAQESMAGVGAASGISASMSGMSSSGTMEAGRRARSSAEGFGSGGSEMGEGGSSSAGGPGGAAAVVAPPKPRLLGAQRGNALLGELLAGQRSMPKIPSPIGKSRSSRGQAELSKKIKNMTEAQRKKLVMQKYDIRPKNWLAHYLKEDRYKISSGLWNFMTTRTSRFYYRPWSAAMLKADPNHVIGFRTWHDAMLAGYRPDPISRPEPATQLVQMASYTQGEGMMRYIEFVYAGQVSPPVFARNYQYVTQVAGILQNYKRRYPGTPPMLGDTINKVLLAAMGEGSVPSTVGGPPAPPPSLNGGMGMNGMSGMSSEFGSSSGMSGSSSSSSGSSSSSSSSSSGNVPANSGSSSRP